MEDNQNTKRTDEFLLAEFNALQSRATNLDNVRASRINFFLVATAAVGAGISSVISNPTFQPFIIPAITIISVIVWLLGFLTLKQSLEDSIAIVIFLRRAGRIRLWFVRNNPPIKQYVAFEYSDDRPVFDVSHLVFRGGEAVIFILNMVTFATFATLLLSPTTFLEAVSEIAIAAILMWFIQNWYAHRKLRDADKTVKGINFRFDDANAMVNIEEQKIQASESVKEKKRTKAKAAYR